MRNEVLMHNRDMCFIRYYFSLNNCFVFARIYPEDWKSASLNNIKWLPIEELIWDAFHG